MNGSNTAGGYPEPVEWLRALAPAVAGRYADLGGTPEFGQCMRWAAAAAWAVNERGGLALVQAGAAFLRRLPPGHGRDEDDFFGHAFDLHAPATAAALAADEMPEFHAWVAVKRPIRGEALPAPQVADYSAAWFPAASAAAAGKGWEVPPPPACVGGPAVHGPAGVNASGWAWYEPVAVCTAAVVSCVRRAVFVQFTGPPAGLRRLTGAEVSDALAGAGGAAVVPFPDPAGRGTYPDVGVYAVGPAEAFAAARAVVARDRFLSKAPTRAGVGPIPVG